MPTRLAFILQLLFLWLATACAAPAATPVLESPPVTPALKATRGVASAARTETAPRAATLAHEMAETLSAPPEAPPPASACRLSESRRFFGLYRNDPFPRGEVVLTFDDGPHPSKTPKVLALLEKYEMPATFFVVGRAINRKTFELIQRTVAEGHTLGSHTYNHDVGMALRDFGEVSIEYIRSQHEVTRILVDLALLAESGEDFDSMYERVFGEKPLVYLSSRSIRTDWPAYAEQHEAIVRARRPDVGAWVYPIVYSRPPGGNPYVGSPADAVARYDEALRRVGLLNVMWHGGSGDTDPAQRHDFGFLTGNLRHLTRRGGIALIHDYMRTDALGIALKRIAGDPETRVVHLAQAVERKFGCSPQALGRALAPTATR